MEEDRPTTGESPMIEETPSVQEKPRGGEGASAANGLDVRHEPEERRFVVSLEEGRAMLDYEPMPDGRWNLRRTFVPEEARGRGIATRLVRQVLDRLAGENLRVVASCWFVADFIDENPDYRSLLAEDIPGEDAPAEDAPAEDD